MSYLTEYTKLVGLRRKAHLREGADPEFVLQFQRVRARGRPLSVPDWVETMRMALLSNDPESDLTYNKFDLARVAEALQSLPDISVAPAREFSPAIYVSGSQESLNALLKQAKRLGADEVAFQEDGSLRLWWN
jgi:hypothetical protein